MSYEQLKNEKCSMLKARCSQQKIKIMKKTLLLTLALLLSTTIFAQNRISYIHESFDSEDFPTEWTFEGKGVDNWQIVKTHQAGGEPNEMKLYWKPSFEGVARLVSPALNLTDVTNIVVSFKAFLDNHSNGHKMGVATTSDNGATWNLAWEDYYSSDNQGQHSFVKVISTPDMGKENVKFCIFFEGNSGYINGWYFDDIDIYTIDELNLGLMSVDMPEVIGTKDNEISFTTKNTGEETITSFTASFQIDDNEAVVETFETNIASLKMEQFSFQEKVDITPGSHKLTVSILSVNGKEDTTSDNVISSEINIAFGTVQRKPMIEHFSSPTCAPCVLVNQAMALLTEKHHGQYTYTKFPLDYPTTGDPYYTDECRERKKYYSVAAAPTIFLNGDLYGNNAIVEQDFMTEYNIPAYIELKGAFNVNENDSTINITVDIMPFVNIYNKRLFVTVNEKTTTGNASYNGETEFHHIMMKMLPNHEGTTINLTAGEMQHFEFSYNMNETFMEELNDLEVAAWIQDYESFVIYNSNYMYEYTEHPYPVQNLNLTDNDSTLLITWEAPEQGTPVAYNIYINDTLVVENHKELSYSTKDVNDLIIVNVVAVYENDKTSAGVIDNILIDRPTESISENTTSLNIYPNPTNDKLYIETQTQTLTVEIYDVYGRRQKSIVNSQRSTVIDLSDLKSGIYFVKINTEKGNIVKRIIKQ